MTTPYAYSQSSVIAEEISIRKITGGEDQVIDLRGKYSYLEINESIFENTMYGSIGIIDSIGMIEDLPIIGEEIITVRYRTSPSSFLMDKEFRVYALENAVLTKEQGSLSYILRFCSPEMFTSEKFRVRRSYKNKKIVDIVQDLYAQLDSDKPFINADDTSNSQNIVVSNMKPLQAINMACNLAKSPSQKSSFFLFYENRDGFNFRNIESLYTAGTQTVLSKKFRTSEGLSSEPDPDTLNQIIAFTFKKQFDHLNSVGLGMFKNKTIGLDMLVKSAREVVFDYNEEFSTMGKTQDGFKLISDDFDAIDDSQQIKLVTSRTLRNKSSYFKNHNGEPSFEKTMEDIYPFRLSAAHQIYSQCLEVIVPGNTNLMAGTIVDIDLPSMRMSHLPVVEKRHKTMSGRYLVSSIKHTFGGGKYNMQLTLNKNVYPSEMSK